MNVSCRYVLFFAAVSIAPASAAYLENFDSVANLTTLGWTQQNNSSPVGTTGWFQGNPGIFSAQSGASNSYIAANFSNTGNTGVISDWLLSPAMYLASGGVFSFYTRTESPVIAPDRLEVRLSTSGFSTNIGSTATSVGDFSTLLLTINPTLTASGYPTAWTQYNVNLPSVLAGSFGRIAFRYSVTDAGADAANANYIGIDTFSASGDRLPEPGTGFVLGSGLVGLYLWRLRRRA